MIYFSILYVQNNLFVEQEDGSEEEEKENDAGLSQQLSKLISQRRSRKKNELVKSLKNQVKYYMLLTSCI